ncbi:hypothetical protein [Actinomadura litoris]|uniref:Uncharacterized protein n=1 Tax=Actinomadura litoris TaxID=2678616 RepID=A0A7K1L4X5_9ACTN|nr:hypothetical protein [Actinomadura litoris]MUN39471.1 hypothetical protein [Actinomadura litoris]
MGTSKHAASAAVLAGASGDGSGTPKDGGTLTFAVGSDTGCVDPRQVGSNDAIPRLGPLVTLGIGYLSGTRG